MTLSPQAVLWLRAALAERLGGGALTLFEPGDWVPVQLAASRHNVEPLLFDLVEGGGLVVPAATREIWEAQYYRNQTFNHSVVETLVALLTAAEEKSLHVIVLKGPVAIARRLGDPGLRVMVDLDLLCRDAELAKLAEIANSLGFRAVGEDSIYHLTFHHHGLGLGLELHFDLYETLAKRQEFAAEVSSGAERLDLEGVSILAPSEASEIVLQLAHLLNHDYRVDLRHWLDFALTLMEKECLDPELRRLLRLTDLEPEYREAVALASALFGVRSGGPDRTVDSTILRGIEEGLLNLRDDRALLSGARVHPDWRSRARYTAQLLVPSPRRWSALAVSEGTGVGRAIWRHLGRAIQRGRTKIERRAQSAAPADSPRARLFARRVGARRR